MNHKNSASDFSSKDAPVESTEPMQSWELKIRHGLRHLPDEVPSLAWRSQLNEKIRAKAAEKTKKDKANHRFWFVFSPTLGAGIAVACGIIVLSHAPHSVASSTSPIQIPGLIQSTRPLLSDHPINNVSSEKFHPGTNNPAVATGSAQPAQPSLEDSLVAEHTQSAVERDITGSGLSQKEIKGEAVLETGSSTNSDTL